MKTYLRIRTQLLLLSGTLLALIVLLGVGGLLVVKHESGALRSVYADRVVPLSQIKQVADKYAVDIVDATHKVRDGGMTPEQAQTSIRAAQQAIQTTWQDYKATQLVEQEKTLIAQLEPLMRATDKATGDILSLIVANDLDNLRAYAATQMYPAFDPMQDVIAQLIQVQLDVAQQVYERSEKEVRILTLVISAAVVGALLLGLGLALRISNTLVRRLGAEPHEVRAVAQAVTAGDLSVQIALRPGDQTSVMAAMKDMSEHLGSVVRGVRAHAESVAAASAQIAQGNQDLAGRTEQQASSLEGAASAMEQLGSTARQNADNARLANQLAATASGVAVQGGNVVAQVVQTMKDINDSSRKISDIIGVIDGIAFQTNILALNAAVEAARAGEQGRGFAVVAGEVRNLAQRSAEAAKEIKGLISSSVDRVGQGSQLVDQAGNTMQEIVTSIQRVSDIVGEISSASHEQNLGVSQVSESVVKMDEATQQNAALVEESAAAAHSLHQQAKNLVQSVLVFRLQASSDQTVSPVPAVPLGASATIVRTAWTSPVAKPASSSAAPAALPKPAPVAAQVPPRPGATPKAASDRPAPAPAPAPLGRALAASRQSALAYSDEGDWESF